jgi:hypothetical protein
MKKWAQQIEAQRRRYRERTRNSDGSRAGGTSQTEFEFMRNQPNLENPYARPGEEDEEDDSEAMHPAGLDQASPMATDTATSRRAATHLRRLYAHGAPQASQMDLLQVLLRSLEHSLRVCHQAHSRVSLSFL